MSFEPFRGAAAVGYLRACRRRRLVALATRSALALAVIAAGVVFRFLH